MTSSGDLELSILISDENQLNLQVATAFGSSMLPFLKPGAELRSEPIKGSSIRIGDVVTFKSKQGFFVTHRVVNIFRHEAHISFLTKGDNRLNCDPPVLERQIIGRVNHANGKNIRSWGWRVLGKIIALISYSQSVFCLGLSKSYLNRIRHGLENKGWFPKIPLYAWVASVVNPVNWLTQTLPLTRDCRIRWFQHELGKKNIKIKLWSLQDTGPMAQLWNEVFLNYPTTPDRLMDRVLPMAKSGSSRVFLAMKSEILLGWVMVRLDANRSKSRKDNRTGTIDVFVMKDEGWKMGLDKVLFLEILKWFKKCYVRQIFLNPQPMPENPLGIALTPLLAAAATFGFEPTKASESQEGLKSGVWQVRI